MREGMKVLSKEKVNRWQSAEEFARARDRIKEDKRDI